MIYYNHVDRKCFILKKKNNIFVKKIIKRIDEEAPISAKEYEMMGYITLAAGIILSGISIVNQKKINDLSFIFPLVFTPASFSMFRAADEVRSNNIKKILVKNMGVKNEYRKK